MGISIKPSGFHHTILISKGYKFSLVYVKIDLTGFVRSLFY